ncbi:MAG: DUF2334 domain-containing protein [Rhodococcus sp.]|uniref:DUF2334 domain-containing protein n=1 Tax=Rhodococcus TaxID=1827 RepID=UPI00169B6640|nr:MULTISPECIES: DUF2334 domain-containing protein [Rhodococcus]NLV79809.1 DUF2334 domain-containing protein [Rhodococcus sp. (in: high G+C Gram-positive bacteria)]
MSGRMIVSVSGIRDTTRDVVDGFAKEMDARGVPLSLFVAPRLSDHYRLVRDPATQEWLLERREGGDAIVLHGYDQAATKRRRAEFSSLPEHEATLRLLAADRVLEDTGLRTRLFAPPRWTASKGAVAALPRIGFRLLADISGIHDLERGTVVRSRVYGIGQGAKAEPWWCRAMVIGAGRVARRGELLRLAISAKHLAAPGPRQAMLDAVDLALHHGAEPTVYRWRRRSESREAA